MADDLIQQGVNALQPKENSPQAHILERTPQVQAELHAYHNDEYVDSGTSSDGDNPIQGHRLAYNPVNENDRGKRLDAWETRKSDDWLVNMSDKDYEAYTRKMDKQVKSLAKLLGEKPEDVSYEDVWDMGDESAAYLKSLTQEGGRVNLEGEAKISNLPGDSRTMGQGYINANGEDLRDLMNTPEHNADFYSKDNHMGQVLYRQGDTRKHGDEAISDQELDSTIAGKVGNVAATTIDMMDRIADKYTDAVSDTISSMVYSGDADLDSDDKSTHKRILVAKKEAGKAAQLEADKQAASPEFKLATNDKIDNVLAEQLDAMAADGITSPTKNIDPKLVPIDVEARTEEILRKSLSKSDLAFYDGEGTTENASTVTTAITHPRNKDGSLGIGSTTETTYDTVKDDRFETLEKRRKLRGGINKAVGDVLIADPKENQKIDETTGAPISRVKANPLLRDRAREAAKPHKEKADKLYDEGKYGAAAIEWLKGPGTALKASPMAAFEGAVDSAGDVAASIAMPALSILANTHNNYKEMSETFFKERGHYPKEGTEQKIAISTSAVAAIMEQYGDKMLVGNVAEAPVNALKDLLAKGIGAAPTAVAAITAGAFIEGVQEIGTEAVKQIGTNQGKDKIFDSSKLYATWIEGVLAGGMMKSVMDAPNVPAYIKDDLQSAAKKSGQVIGLGVAGVKAVQGKIEGWKQAKVDRKEEVVKSNDAKVNVDSVPTQGEVLVEKMFSSFEGKADEAIKAKRAEDIDNIADEVATATGQSAEEVLKPNAVDIDPDTYDFSQHGFKPTDDTVDAPLEQVQESASTEEITEPTQEAIKPKPKVEPKVALANKVKEITDLPTELFQSEDGLVEVQNHAMTLKTFISEETQAITEAMAEGNSDPKELMTRAEAIQEASTQYSNLQANIIEQQSKATAPTGPVNSVGELGNVLAHGSAAVKQIDTTGMAKDLFDMVESLKAFDALVDTVVEGTPKSMDQVTGEVMGTRTNELGKAGLGQHMSNLGAAIAAMGRNVPKAEAARNAANVLIGMENFKGLQEAKYELFQKGLEEWKNGKGKPVTINYGNKGKETFVISGDPSKSNPIYGMLRQIKTEINAIEKGIDLSSKLATAVFDPRQAKKNAQAAHTGNRASKKPTPAKPITVVQENASNLTYKDGSYKHTSIIKSPNKYVRSLARGIDKIVDTLNSYHDYDGLTAAQKAEHVKLENQIRKLVGMLPEQYSELVKDFNEGISTFEAKEGIAGLETTAEELSTLINNIAATTDTETGDLFGSAGSQVTETTSIGVPEGDLPYKGTLNKKAQEARDAILKLATQKAEPKRRLGTHHLKNLKGILSDSELAGLTDTKTPGRRERLKEAYAKLAEIAEGTEVLPEVSNSIKPPKAPVQPTEPTELEQEANSDLASLLAVLQGAREVPTAKTNTRNVAINDIVEANKDVQLRGYEATAEEVEKGSVVVESASTKKLRPFHQMMTAKLTKPKGLIGIFSDMFTSLKYMSAETITPEEREALVPIEAFVNELGDALDITTPQVTSDNAGGVKLVGGKPTLFREDANKSPITMLMDKNGNLPKMVKDAIGIAVLDWFQAHGTSTTYLSERDIYSFFGMDEQAGGLSPETIAEMQTKGIHATPVAMQIGLAVLDNLNITQVKDTALDGNFKARLAQSIGDVALVAMENMTDSNKESRGYIVSNSVPVKHLNAISGESLKIDDVEGSADPRANFIRVPTMEGADGRPVYDGTTMLLGKSTTELKKLTDSSVFKTTMRKIIGKTRRDGGVSAIPSKRIPKHITGSSSAIPPVERDYIKSLNNATLVKNPMWDLMREFGDVDANLDLWFKIQGFEVGELQEDGTMKFPELHDADAVTAEGKNAGIIRSHENSKQFEVNYEADRAELDAEILKTQDLLELVRAEDTNDLEDVVGDRAALKKELTNKILTLQKEVEAFEKGHIHIEHHMVKTSRVHSRGDTLSVQNDKVQRNMLSLKDSIETIDIQDKAQRFAMIASLVEPLGLNKKAFSSFNKANPMNEFHEKFMDKNGDAKDPAVRKAIEALVEFEKGNQLGREDFEAITEVLTNKEYGLKEGMHSLSGLMVVAAWSNAVKNGTYKFTSYGYAEVDGTTNGVMAANRQLLGGFKIDKPEAEWTEEEHIKVQRIRNLLNSGGHILEGDDYVEAMDYLQEGLDAYQNLAKLSADRIHPAISKVGRGKGTKSIANLREDRNSLYRLIDGAEKSKANKIKFKDREMDLVEAYLLIDEVDRDLGLAIFKPTLMNSGLVTGNVEGDSNLRNMMKAFVMPGGYGAGDTALSNSGFFDWLGNTYTQTMKYKLQSKSAEEFEVLMGDINETLASAGVATVTYENAHQMYSKQDIETLRRIYRKSVGAEITAAYRESMGDYTENAQAITSAMGVVDIINTAHLNKVLAIAEAAKKGGALTAEEKMTIRQEEQKKGIYLGYRHVDATSHGDSRAFITESKKVISKERGGSVQTKMAKNVVQSTKWVEKDGRLVADGTMNASSRTSNLTEWVPEANLGSAALPFMTIGTDATTNARAGLASKVDRINVFDANITGALSAAAEAVTTNSTWNNLMEEFSMWKATEERLDFMAEHAMTPEAELALKDFFTPYNKDSDGVETGNKNAPHYLREDGQPVYFAGLKDFTAWFKGKVVEGEIQRKYTNSLVLGVAQHAHPGGTSATKHTPDTETAALNEYAGRYDVPPIYRGSSADQIDPNSFDDSMRSVATPARVSNLFTEYVDAANNTDSQEHKNQLADLMNNHIMPLLNERDLTLYLDTGTSELGGLSIEDTVYVRATDKTIRRLSSEMSDAEVLVHEFLHPIIEEGFKNNTSALKAVTQFMKAARDSQEFTVDALIDPTTIDPIEARKEAQALYDYVTGNPHEFMTHGLSNAKVRNLLAKVKVADKKPQNLVERMLEKLGDLVRTLRGIQKDSPSNAQQGVDAVMKSFDKSTQIHLARKVAKTINNKYVTKGRGFLANRVAKPVVAWATAKSPDHRKKGLSELVKLPFQIYLPSFTKVLRETVTEVTKYRHGFFAKLTKEAIGPQGVGKDFTRLLSKVNEHVESASLRVSAETSRAVQDAFVNPVSTKQWLMLTDTVLRGDFKVFGKDYTPEQVATLIRDTETRRKTIDAITNGLASTDKQWISTQANSLGSVMVRGYPITAKGNLNAFNIVTGVGRSQGNSGLTEADLGAVDMLKTLWAIEHMSDANRKAVADMIMAEPEGIRTMLDVDMANHEETLQGTYKGDRTRVVAGSVTAVSTTRSQTVILPRRDHAKHIAAGMEMVKQLPSGMGLYSRTAGATEDYQKGAFSMGSTTLEGTIVRLEEYNPITHTNLLPVVTGGRITAYRAIMDAETRRVDAGMNIKANESLGNHAGRTLRLSRGDSFNRTIIEDARKDYLENGRDSKAYIRIHKDSKNPQVAEFAKLMPKQMYNDIQKEWKGDMYLRQEHLDLLIGYRKIAATDKINGLLRGKGSKEMSAAISGAMRLTGDVWQDVVGEVKRRTVLFTPAVVAANQISNVAISVMLGMNPVDVLRDQVEGWKAIKNYTKLQDQLAAVDLDLKLGRDTKTNLAKKHRLELTMQSSGVHDLVEAGVFQTIVEDIDIKNDSPLLKTISGLLPEAITDKVETAYIKAPSIVKTGIGLAMLSPSTKLGSDIQTATAYSDFVARYAMYRHLLKEGKSKQDAMDDIRDIFVDYAPNTSDKMQYINDMGGFMYTKFLIRIQRVILKALKERPESVAAMEAGQAMTGVDLPDIVDAHLLGINLTGGGRTLTPGEAYETLSTIPGWHAVSGIGDLF